MSRIIASLDDVKDRPPAFRLGFADGYALHPQQDQKLPLRTQREVQQYRAGHRAGRRFWQDQHVS